MTRRTVSAEIRQRLADAIHSGQLAPGTQLPAERVLCQEFGVARTSVREAIQGLVIAGYLERRGNRSVVAEHLPAINFTGDDRKAHVKQLFEVRQVIEPAIAEMAARRATDAERAEIGQIAARNTRNLVEFREIDRSFHAALARACGNPLLNEVHAKALAALFGSGEFESLLYAEVNRAEVIEIIDSSTEAHRAIADAVVKGAQSQGGGRGRRSPRRRRASDGGAVAMNAASPSNMADQYCYFFDDELFDETDRPGFRRRIIVGDHLELWFWRIKGGTEGSFLHNHDVNEQLGIIMRGSLDFRIGEPDDQTRKLLHAGDFYLAPPTVWHGDSIFIGDDEYGEVLDPRRLRAAAHRQGARRRADRATRG